MQANTTQKLILPVDRSLPEQFANSRLERLLRTCAQSLSVFDVTSEVFQGLIIKS